jgi:multidrug resistance efflux pump
MWKKLLLPLAAVALTGWAVYNVFAVQKDTRTAPAPSAPARSPYAKAVAGAGIVEPNTLASGTGNVAVGTELAGKVKEVYVARLNQHFEKGEALFRLDDAALKAELAVRQANVKAAQAQLAKMEAQARPEEVAVKEKAVSAALATAEAAQDAYDRAARVGPGGIAAGDLATLKGAAEKATSDLKMAEADLALLKAGAREEDREIARAAVKQAEALRDQTLADLDRLTVKAPISGEVLQINVRPGESVAPQPGPGLIVMGDTSTLLVRVSIDESDIPRLKLDAPALAYNRGTPQHEYKLKFLRVEPYVVPKTSLTGDNAERVDTRVLQVIYAIQKPSPTVYVGDLLDVFIDAGGQPLPSTADA